MDNNEVKKQMPTREQLYGKHTRFTTIPTEEYEQLLQLKAENKELKEQHKWDKKREQFNGDIMWGKDEHNNKCLEDLMCTLMERNTTIKSLTQKLEKARVALEAIYNDKYQYTCDYIDCTCWDLAQQALKELE